jgi:cyclophilin family peptidyl-prolyl cis-trans isomerase
MLIRACIVCLLCLAPLLAPANGAVLQPPTTEEIQAAQKQGRFLATLTLENGKTIEIVLEGGYMPVTVANFVKLIKAGYYHGMDFTTAVSQKLPDGSELGFVSGGDPTGAGPGYRLPLEVSPYLLEHKRGAVSMLSAGSTQISASQFVISFNVLPMYDGRFLIFGWVKSDMAVVDEIQKGDLIKTATVVPYKGAEACPILTPMPAAATQPPPTKADIDAVRKQGRYLVTINMENGKKIVLVLEGKEMPVTVANFIKLAQAKYYDGVVFHRVETGTGMQLVQGGDPEGTGRGGPGYQIRFEKSDLLNKTGAVGMARTQDPNSAGSQFYILNSDVAGFDGNYAIFGWVKEGQDVVKGIKIGDRMKYVTVAPYKGTEACPVMKQ